MNELPDELPEIILPPATALENNAAAFLKATAPASNKPSYINSDIWDIMQEAAKKGGLADMREEIGSLTDLELAARADPGLTAADRIRLVTTIVEKKIKAKTAYAKIQETRRNFITYDMFVVLLDDFYRILQDEVQDPITMKRISTKLGIAASRLADVGKE